MFESCLLPGKMAMGSKSKLLPSSPKILTNSSKKYPADFSVRAHIQKTDLTKIF